MHSSPPGSRARPGPEPSAPGGAPSCPGVPPAAPPAVQAATAGLRAAEDARAPAVSVVIPTCNRTEHLREAIEGVRAGTLQEFEVLVMDQSDDDSTKAMVLSLGDARLHYVRVPRKGACPARNLGAAMARAELIAWLDDDCTPLPDWLERIRGAFGRDPGLQFIFGELRPPQLPKGGGGYPEFRPGAFSPYQRRHHWKVAMVAAGANMSTRKAFLRQVGGFDESLGPARPDVKSNDASMSYKVWRSGARWVATSQVAVIHTNGFRREEDLRALYRGYAHGLGVHYGRFVRRRDARALDLFLREEAELLRWPIGRLIRLQKPVGLRPWLAHLQGFFDGVRLAPAIGHVTGEVFRAMETTRMP